MDKKRFFLINQFADKLRIKGIDCLVIDDLDIYDKDNVGSKYLKWVGSPKKFQKILSDFEPDVIFTERLGQFSSLVIKANIPLIIFVRGEDGIPHSWSKIDWNEKLIKKSLTDNIQLTLKDKIAEKCCENCTAILPICHYLEKVFREKLPNKNMHVLYQGIDECDWFKQDGIKLKHPCIGLVQDANIWEKTKELLILPKILEKLPQVNFYWAGDGPYRTRILEYLEKYENFHWLGSLEYPSKVREFLTEIDLYALISGIDMSPHTLLEAGLMEKPVLATDVGGISESCKNNETCFLIEKNNHNEWIKKITMLLNNKEKMNDMGKKGKIFVKENFLWDKITDDFIKLLKSMKI